MQHAILLRAWAGMTARIRFVRLFYLRQYAMLNERGQLLSVTKHSELFRARAATDPTTGYLRLELPEGRLLEGVVELGPARHGLFYGEERPCRVVFGEFSDALSALVGEPVTLVSMLDGPAVDRPGEGAVTVQSAAALAELAPAAGLSALHRSRPASVV
jgi:hypothetical protein